jgi:putative ABC transport system ATP-binding protein
MELKSGLACRGLDFRWPGERTDLLRSVNAAFSAGTFSLVTGATGAGKSTLLHLLAGLLRPTAGEIQADGQSISRWTTRHRDLWRRNTGIVFQHLGLIPDLSAAENLLLPLIPRNVAWSRMQADIARALVAADLAELVRSPVSSLSGGQRQRLAIARALVGRPRFILADEPTAYQDDGHTAQLCVQLSAAAREGAAVVVCSHDPRLRQSRSIDRRFHLADAALSVNPAGPETP